MPNVISIPSECKPAIHSDLVSSLAIRPGAGDGVLFARATMFGMVGLAAGALVYGLFMAITGIDVGYLAIGVAWLVARMMMVGSRDRGGPQYQVTALLLTYLAVAIGEGLSDGISAWRSDGPFPLSPRNLSLLARDGLASPLLDLRDSAGWGLLGILILFVGLRAAWRMTSGEPGAVRRPFSR
jgi:hypothetical protein